MSAVMRLIRRLIYELGMRPRPGSILYSPSLALRLAADEALNKIRPQ